jgi:hypothetical protein
MGDGNGVSAAEALEAIGDDIVNTDSLLRVIARAGAPHEQALAAKWLRDLGIDPGQDRITAHRRCDVTRLRERENLQLVPLAEMPEGHGLGEALDEITGGGIAPGSLVGIGAAGTGVGKTALLMQALDGLALRSAVAADDPDATVPLTPTTIISEMAEDDLEVRTLGRLLGIPGTILAAGRSARRWHPHAWVQAQYDHAAALMQPGGTFARITAWQRYLRTGRLAGPSLLAAAETEIAAWADDLARANPGREIVPVLAVDPIDAILPLDGRSPVETLGEMAALLDELADRRRWIVAFTVDTNKASASGANGGNTTAPAVFRGTMQLLHRCDLALVLSPEDPDPDGVRSCTLLVDKNRTGRSDAVVGYRWHTKHGLRFVPEDPTDTAKRARARQRPSPEEQIDRLCRAITTIIAAGQEATERRLRAFSDDIGTTQRGLGTLVAKAQLAGRVREREKKPRGGGTAYEVVG